MMMRLTLAAMMLLLAACGSAPVRVELPPVPEKGKVAIGVGAVEVREATLPLYAAQETIYIETPSGELASSPDLLWADDPRRSFTEGLAIALAAHTRARVAAEPWPFYERPEARVEVRFSRALASRDGQYRVSGQYYVSSADGTRPDVARRFTLAEPYAAENAVSIAAAKARVIDALALQIARDGL